MQTIITIDMTGATAPQALELVAHLNRKGLAFEVGNRVEVTDDVASKLLAAVENTDGAVSSILSRSGLTESQVQRGLRALREADKVFMVGSRRFARYGTTLAQATERSEAAQGKTS